MWEKYASLVALLTAFVLILGIGGCRRATGKKMLPEGQEAVAAMTEKTLAPHELRTARTSIRVATYNVALYRDQTGQLIADLADGRNDQAHQIAHLIQLVRPDVLLLNEFDYDADHAAAEVFRQKYLGVGHGSTEPIAYPYMYTNDVNTGVPSGVDLDRDGKTGGGSDCFGFGKHPGQYGMLVLSKFPVQGEKSRTFRKLRWTEMPDALLPVDPQSEKNFYSDEALKSFRVSSKSHWDVLIDVQGIELHFLVSHPTPPVFDGPEDRNGRRNHDEIRLWADYVSGDPSNYIVDDEGQRGGLAEGCHFVIAGDLNADPNDGDSHQAAIQQLTEHPLIQASPIPSSQGAVEVASAGVNRAHKSNPAYDTADFDDQHTGNLRADYVLPSKTMKVLDCGVFWPSSSNPHHQLIDASDHRPVWVDLQTE